MKLLVRRQPSANGCTIGEFLIDGSFEAFSLEDVVREIPRAPVREWKVDEQTAIPSGTYKVVIDVSPHFQRRTPHILSVPGFTGVRIHSGNVAADTEGCILLGMGKTDSSVTGSRLALAVVQPVIQKALDAGEEVTITICNA